MIIKANRASDYVFLPSYSELAKYHQKFGLLTINDNDGFSFLTYINTSKLLIKNRVYSYNNYNYTAKHTEEFKTVTLKLGALGLAIAVDDGHILDATKGLKPALSNILDYTENGFKIIGLPQLFGVYLLNGGEKVVIIGIYGNYDFNTNLFYGILDTLSYTSFLSRATL